MKVYTCTPVRFKGDYTFFARESGLFSVGLNGIGVESRPIMPGPTMDDDDPRLIRTEYINLESADWWRSMNLDGLILYSWASPKYNKIAQAVKIAGIPFLVNMDTSGLISSLAPKSEWWRESHKRFLYECRTLRSIANEVCRIMGDLLYKRSAKSRLAHYEAATSVAAVTPLGSLWIPGEVNGLGRSDLTHKFTYLPHPQLEVFNYGDVEKENLVITVGRWEKDDWPQKNPRTLLNAYAEFLHARPDWKGIIVGKGAKDLANNLQINNKIFNGHLDFIDYVPPNELPAIYSKSKIGFWSSRWEGQQGTGAQALCCGCSVVSHDSAHMSCFRHYVTRGSGRLARHNDASALARELILEAQSWDEGNRDPKIISSAWSNEFHASNVASRSMELLNLKY